jgi:hypothetical protein
MNIKEIRWEDNKENLKILIKEGEMDPSLHLSSGYIEDKKIVDIYYNYTYDCIESHCYEIEFKKSETMIEHIWSEKLKKLNDVKDLASVYFKRYLESFCTKGG